MIPVIAAAGVISGITKIAGGVIGSNSAKKNAKIAEQLGIYNATLTMNTASQNAESIMDLANLNVRLGTMSNLSNTQVMVALAEHNARLREFTSEYDARLLENEVKTIYDALELDEYLFDQQIDQLVGKSKVQYAHNGWAIDSGTALGYRVDQRTQAELEKFVMRYNADVSANRIMNEAAITRWNGFAEAQTIRFEAKANSKLSILNQMFSNVQTMGQATYDSFTTMMNANLQAQGIIAESQAQGQFYRNRASSELISSLFSAAGSAASVFGSSYTPGATS